MLELSVLEFNNDQRREMVNTSQRFEAWQEATRRLAGFRGSMVWSTSKGRDYLLRSSYSAAGKRTQHSLGLRSEMTEVQKQQFDNGRANARERLDTMRAILARQAAVNRALRLGRVPGISASILRMLDEAGWLDHGIRVAGTHSLYAYEAAAGIFLDAGITTTEDIDLLQDARMSLRFAVSQPAREAGLIGLLKRVDKSFERSRQTFRAINQDGFFVDLIRPVPNPPWKAESPVLREDDLQAVGIDGLEWLENAPSFNAVTVDDQGIPCRMAVVDPRVFAAHKLWVSQQPGRDPAKRKRDLAQAQAVAALCVRYFAHLPYESSQLRMLPKAVFEQALPLFVHSEETRGPGQ